MKHWFWSWYNVLVCTVMILMFGAALVHKSGCVQLRTNNSTHTHHQWNSWTFQAYTRDFVLGFQSVDVWASGPAWDMSWYSANRVWGPSVRSCVDVSLCSCVVLYRQCRYSTNNTQKLWKYATHPACSGPTEIWGPMQPLKFTVALCGHQRLSVRFVLIHRAVMWVVCWASWHINCYCGVTSNEENERSKKKERRRIKERRYVRQKVKES
jgi:hypothetical protein